MKTFLILILLSIPSLAQDAKAIKAKTDPPLPASVEITAKADIDLINKAKLELENVQLKARNYELEIAQQLELAKKQLSELQAKAAEQQAKWQTMLSAMTNVPSDKLGEYDMAEKDGKIVLTRKVK